MSQSELTGRQVNYYLVQVSNPSREEQPPYQAECEDIIRALGMTFDEGTVFKSLWRSCNMRKHGNGKPGADRHGVYDAEKIVHASKGILKERKREKSDALAVKAHIETALTSTLRSGNGVDEFIKTFRPDLIKEVDPEPVAKVLDEQPPIVNQD